MIYITSLSGFKDKLSNEMMVSLACLLGYNLLPHCCSWQEPTQSLIPPYFLPKVPTIIEPNSVPLNDVGHMGHFEAFSIQRYRGQKRRQFSLYVGWNH